MTLAHNPRIVTDGLVFCLDAANPKSYPGSGTVWNDLSGNGNNGTLVNGVGYSSDNKGSLTFDGSNDSVTFSTWGNISGQSGTVNITMDSWFKTISTPPNTVMGYLGFNSPTNFFKFMNTANLFLDTYNTNNSSRTLINVITNFSDYFGQWVNVCGVYDGVYAKSYHNGTLVNSTAITLADISAVNFSVGVGMGYYNFNGNNASCKLYNRALSESEIKQNYNATKGRYGL